MGAKKRTLDFLKLHLIIVILGPPMPKCHHHWPRPRRFRWLKGQTNVRARTLRTFDKKPLSEALRPQLRPAESAGITLHTPHIHNPFGLREGDCLGVLTSWLTLWACYLQLTTSKLSGAADRWTIKFSCRAACKKSRKQTMAINIMLSSICAWNRIKSTQYALHTKI